MDCFPFAVPCSTPFMVNLLLCSSIAMRITSPYHAISLPFELFPFFCAPFPREESSHLVVYHCFPRVCFFLQCRIPAPWTVNHGWTYCRPVPVLCQIATHKLFVHAEPIVTPWTVYPCCPHCYSVNCFSALDPSLLCELFICVVPIATLWTVPLCRVLTLPLLYTQVSQ